MVEEASVCQECGTNPADFDPEQGGHRIAFIPDVYTCPGCKVKGDALDSAMDDARKLKQSTRGMKVRLVDRLTFRKLKASRREQEKAEYKKYREEGGRGMTRKRQAEAQAGKRVTAPDGSSLATPPVKEDHHH